MTSRTRERDSRRNRQLPRLAVGSVASAHSGDVCVGYGGADPPSGTYPYMSVRKARLIHPPLPRETPARFTSLPDTAMSRTRIVRATVRRSTGPGWPRVAVQRRRLWASTAHCSQALIAAGRIPLSAVKHICRSAYTGMCRSPYTGMCRSRRGSVVLVGRRWHCALARDKASGPAGNCQAEALAVLVGVEHSVGAGRQPAPAGRVRCRRCRSRWWVRRRSATAGNPSTAGSVGTLVEPGRSRC